MPALDKVSDLGDYLREQRHGAKLSLRQLAEAAGVSNPYLSQVERGLRRPSAEVLQQIARGLRISAEALYVRAGILEEREDRITVEAAVLADPKLSERQRRVLLDIYTTFCAEHDRHEPAAPPPPVEPEPQPGPASTAPRSTTPRSTTPRSKTPRSKTPRSASTPSTTTRPATRRASRGGN